MRKLGEGTFGKVYQCKTLTKDPIESKTKEWRGNHTTDEDVAIKIIRSKKKYRYSAFIEINTIQIMHLRQPFLHK